MQGFVAEVGEVARAAGDEGLCGAFDAVAPHERPPAVVVAETAAGQRQAAIDEGRRIRVDGLGCRHQPRRMPVEPLAHLDEEQRVVQELLRRQVAEQCRLPVHLAKTAVDRGQGAIADGDARQQQRAATAALGFRKVDDGQADGQRAEAVVGVHVASHQGGANPFDVVPYSGGMCPSLADVELFFGAALRLLAEGAAYDCFIVADIDAYAGAPQPCFYQ